jgi:hypothetical protein
MQKCDSISSANDEKKFAQRGTALVFMSAIFGDASAQKEMRDRFPGTAAFVDACDPDLPRDSNDSAIMAELKMCGRAVKHVRDEMVDTIFNINAPDSNTTSDETVEHIQHTDGLAKREVAVTRGITLALGGGFI